MGVVAIGGMKGTPDRRVTWAVEQLQARFHEPIAVAALASHVGLSPARFRHLFRMQTGASPSRYLQRLRLRRARLLIERTFLSVREVMALVGYSDPSRFLKDFRQFHGVGPGAIRGDGMTTPLPRSPGSPSDPPMQSRFGQRRAIAALCP